MGEIVNLRRARKARMRAAAEQSASEARAAHGRTPAQRAADARTASEAVCAVDRHRIESRSSDDGVGG
jgi:hypothetical protein